MADRNRIHGSSLNRHQGPTNEHSAPTRRERHKGSIPPKRLERRNMIADKAPWNIDPENNYGSGKRSRRRPVEQDRYGTRLGRQSRAGDDMIENGPDDYDEPRFHNNYDDYDRIYPPSQRW